MKKVKPISLHLESAREQAEYFFNREFQMTSFDLIKNNDFEIVYPDDKHLIDEYLSYDANCEDEYRKINSNFDNETFRNYILDLDSFQEWKDDLFYDYYPMWNTVFSCDRFYIDSNYCNVDTLYDLGIGVLEYDGEYFLFITGAGYDFYDAHWIPLFKHLGWIEEVK